MSLGNQAAVALRGISKSYGQTPAVIDVSFDVGTNEFLSLLGPSGCGKSTILRMIGGFERPNSGSIHLLGQPVDGVPPHRRATNMVFQNLALFQHLTVFENVTFGPRIKGGGKADLESRVRRALDLVHLGGYGDRRINQMSGGQRQRVAIARALVNEPAVLLLDEPFSALDAALRTQMQSELKDIQKSVGTTFVYVTHDQTEALTMSDRIAVLRAGKLEQIGPAREVYDHPQSCFVARFLGDSNIIEAALAGVDGTDASVRVGAHTIAVQAALDLPPGRKIYLSVRPERIRLVGPEAPQAGECRLPARVRRVTFKGPLIESVLLLEDGTPLSVLSASTAAPPVEGDAVTCAWGRGDATLLVE